MSDGISDSYKKRKVDLSKISDVELLEEMMRREKNRPKLKLEIVPFHSLPCSLEVFTINGIAAYESDFGEGRDDSQDTAVEYGCGNRRFHRISPTREVLAKYKITLDEYSEIADALESALCVGSCGWCV